MYEHTKNRRMKINYNLFVLFLLLSSCHSKSQDRIQINIPSAKAEAEYIWRTIQDIQFFEEHNYQVSLPKGALIEELIQNVKSGITSDNDYDRLERFVLDSVYNKSDYMSGYDKISSEKPLINKMINQLEDLNYNWNFKTFELYQINLTLYGPGGSYDPNLGSILIFSTEDGRFKSYKNPSNTIIHEVTHIGIEESIITKLNVPHPLKERIVDTFVKLNFGKYLPNYKIQGMGDERIDKYLKEVNDLKTLDEIVEAILKAE